MRSCLLAALAAAGLLSMRAAAGQITLKNGDRLSGTVIKSDGKELVFKSDLAGTVTVPWDAVTAIASAEPLNIGLRDGQVAVGPVDTVDREIVVSTKDAGKVTAQKAAIVFIRSKEEQAAYDAEIER